MTKLYTHSYHSNFKLANARAREISVENDCSTVVKRSRDVPGDWVVLVPQFVAELNDKLIDEFLSKPGPVYLDEKEEAAALRDMEYAEQLWWEEQQWSDSLERRELQQDIYSDQDDWGRLDEEGWFYED